MIVVDTSVWIDHYRDIASPQVSILRDAMRDEERVALTGVVRMELLRGVSEDNVTELRSQLDAFELVPLDAADFDAAASLYRSARAVGMSVRSVVDCLIAASCIRLGIPLLYSDADFNKLMAVSDLQTVAV